MDKSLLEKLNAIPEEEPTPEDDAMLDLAVRENDGTLVALNDFKVSLEGYSGKMLLRMPKSLHKRLSEEAKLEGVSLNQYALYKLSQR